MNGNNTIKINIDLQPDETIRKLERIKQLVKELKELDNNLNLNNILEIDKESTLVFKTDTFYSKENKERIEKELSNELNTKCILLRCGMSVDKAIKLGIDKRTR